MSDDLSARLRDAHSFMGDPLLKEAADEIERLRAALTGIRAICADSDYDESLRRVVDEIARAALANTGEKP